MQWLKRFPFLFIYSYFFSAHSVYVLLHILYVYVKFVFFSSLLTLIFSALFSVILFRCWIYYVQCSAHQNAFIYLYLRFSGVFMLLLFKYRYSHIYNSHFEIVHYKSVYHTKTHISIYCTYIRRITCDCIFSFVRKKIIFVSFRVFSVSQKNAERKLNKKKKKICVK